MNQVKSTHHTIDHFGSVKYAELVDHMEENGNSKQSCTEIANSPVPKQQTVQYRKSTQSSTETADSPVPKQQTVLYRNSRQSSTETADSPVPVAAVSYQKFIFCNHDTTSRSYCSKNHSMTLLWDRLCLLQQNSITVEDSKTY